MVLAGNDCYEPAARLEDDPRFLCIYVDPSEPAHGPYQGLKEPANLRAFVFEVLINSVVTTRVRHVACDKPLSTCRALPEWPLFLFKCSIAHDRHLEDDIRVCSGEAMCSAVSSTCSRFTCSRGLSDSCQTRCKWFAFFLVRLERVDKPGNRRRHFCSNRVAL